VNFFIATNQSDPITRELHRRLAPPWAPFSPSQVSRAAQQATLPRWHRHGKRIRLNSTFHTQMSTSPLKIALAAIFTAYLLNSFSKLIATSDPKQVHRFIVLLFPEWHYALHVGVSEQSYPALQGPSTVGRSGTRVWNPSTAGRTGIGEHTPGC
jgi:hypothetical protein